MQLDWITHCSPSKCCINKQKNSIEHFNREEEASEVWGIECAAPCHNTKIKVCERAYAYGRCWISNGIHFTCVKNRTKCSLSISFLVHALIIIIVKKDLFTPSPGIYIYISFTSVSAEWKHLHFPTIEKKKENVPKEKRAGLPSTNWKDSKKSNLFLLFSPHTVANLISFLKNSYDKQFRFHDNNDDFSNAKKKLV